MSGTIREQWKEAVVAPSGMVGEFSVQRRGKKGKIAELTIGPSNSQHGYEVVCPSPLCRLPRVIADPRPPLFPPAPLALQPLGSARLAGHGTLHPTSTASFPPLSLCSRTSIRLMNVSLLARSLPALSRPRTTELRDGRDGS